jgi:hypothetical protein
MYKFFIFNVNTTYDKKNNTIKIRTGDIMKNVPFWSIGRSLQSEPPSFHFDLLGKGGGHCPTPFPPRTALPVHGASRTLVFLVCCRPLLTICAVANYKTPAGHLPPDSWSCDDDILPGPPSPHGPLAPISVYLATRFLPLFRFGNPPVRQYIATFLVPLVNK